MKNILILILATLTIQVATSQDIIEQHFSHLTDRDDVTHINVTGKMFEMINSLDIESDDDEVQEMKDFVSSIRSFQLITCDNLTNATREFNDGVRKINSDYEELVNVRSDDGNFKLLIDEHDGTVHEVVGIGSSKNDLMVFSLLGELRLDQVGKIVEHIDAGNMIKMSEVKDLSIDKVKVFPNPARSNSNFSLELPDEMTEANVTLYDLKGRQIRTYDAISSKSNLDLDGVAAGSYVLSIEKGGVEVKKKVLVLD